MAWVTTLGPDMAQVEYRLEGQCGCDLEHQDLAQERDAQVDYRLGEARDLEWIGRGLADVGLVAGTAVDREAARALMDGRDPRTGEVLVHPKVAVDPRAMLAARPLAEAVTAAAERRGVEVAELLGSAKLTKRFERMQRCLRSDGDAHRLPVVDVDAIAAAAGIDAAALYGRETLQEARKNAHRRVRTGNRGYDLTLDLSKTYSTVAALAGQELSEQLRETFLEAARETVAALEDWAAYAMAGEHGNGKTAARVRTSGALGWMTVHYSARPVDGVPGDPHLHVHVNIANMALAEDGKWRTIGAGGRDLHRHAHAADSFVKARLRQLTAERFGMRWERHPQTGAWEVVGVDEDLRREFSRRSRQITEAAGAEASTGEQKLVARRLAEGKDTETAPADVRASWRQRAEAIVGDIDAMIRAAVPGPPGPDGPTRDGPGGGPRVPSPAEIAAHIWREDGKLTASRKAVTRADVLAAVIDACPQGLPDLAAAEALTDAVLAVPDHAVRLPSQGATHLSNAQRYTHTAVLEAEQTIVETATARLGEGAAQITAEAAELALSVFETARSTGDRPFAFSEQQKAVVHRLLTAGHGLDVVVGVAGAGKTTLLAAARSGWEAAGLSVAGASTAAVAAANLQTEAGITSATVAAWLRDIADGGRLMAATDVLVLDEAAMIDDRHLAALLRSANEHGTKVVAVGDWMQLKAIGIGGGFQRAHELVDGLALTENRRQKDAVERAALQAWRDGGRRTALAALAEHGRIHAVETPDEAHAAMLAAWADVRGSLDGDVHDHIEDLAMLAARNEDVEVLNGGARALLKKAGQLTAERTYALAGGERLQLAVGDLVRIRRNDYRSRREPGAVDVLNGYRGVVTYTGPSGVRVQWRRPGEDGQYVLQEAFLTAERIAAGALSHGYAMTIAAAQGLTTEYTLAYGVGAEANTLYPALSRARQETHLWLPAAVLEDDATRRRLGEARSQEELLQRAVAAYAAALEKDQPDGMVSDQVADPAARIPHQEPAPAVVDRAAERRAAAARAASPAPDGQEPPEGPQSPPAGAEAAGVVRMADQAFPRRPKPPQRPQEPQAEHWRRRPWGHLPTAGLERAAAEQLDQAQRAEALAASYERRAAERAGELAAQPSPGQAAAATVAAVLRQADRLAATAQEEGQRAAAAAAAAAKAREILAAVAKTTGQSRLALRLAGTSRKEQRELLAEFTARAAAADGEQRRAQRAAADAHRQAVEVLSGFELAERYRQLGDEPHLARLEPGEMRRRITALQAELPAYAERIDRSRAEDVQRLQRQAAEARGTAAGHREAAAGLRAEQQLRQTLTPEQQAAETAERITADRLARQRAAERQRQLAQQQAAHRYQPPGRGRGGPGLGR